jgi:hypothetical protein
MTNELIFLLQTSLIGALLLLSLRMGKEMLIVSTALQAILANLLTTKEIVMCGLTVTATDAFTIGIVTGINLLQEYWGKKAAFQALIISFVSTIAMTLFMYIHLSFAPSPVDTMHQHFCALFNATPRIIIASLIAYSSSQLIDYFLIGLQAKYMNRHSLLLRSSLSISISQLVDTILVSLIGLYGIVHSVVDIIVFSYTIKLIALGLSMPFVWLSKFFKPNHEQPHE